jgi:SseB protein N-terminal domain
VATAVTDLVPANLVEESLRAARLNGDLQAYVQAVVVSDVLLPTSRAVLDPDAISGAGFPWWSLPDRPDRSIAVFSSAERMAEGLPDARDWVLVPFISVAEFWPGPAYTMVINPDTALELTLSGDSVRQLFDAMRAELSGEQAAIAAALPAVESSPAGLSKGADSAVGGGAPLVELQKVIAHDDLPGYLRDGRNLVTGFVYPAEGLRHLTTPAALYAGLGLLYDGSPFQQTDTEVHVLRWLAHCPILYRLARGGPDEATRLSNRGWMVEPAPFRGTGVSAGDAQVPELKVDSVAVPHGAVLVKLTSGGAQTVVASFDADFASWLPVVPVDLGAMVGPS